MSEVDPQRELLPPAAKEFAGFLVEKLLQEEKEAVKKLLKEAQEVDKRMLWIAVISAIIAVLATSAAVWSAYEAHMTRKEGLEAANKAMTMEQRPYLKLSMVEFETKDASGKEKIELPQMTITSYGRTPAFNITVRTRCVFIGGNEAKNVYTSPYRSAIVGGVLAPGDSNTGNAQCSPQEVFAWGLTGKKAFFVQGTIYYDDIFKGRHEQAFCFEHHSSGDSTKWVDCPSLELEKQPSNY